MIEESTPKANGEKEDSPLNETDPTQEEHFISYTYGNGTRYEGMSKNSKRHGQGKNK